MTSRYKPLLSVYHRVNNLEDRLTIHISKDKSVLKWRYPLFNSPCCALRCIGLEAHTGNWVSFRLTLVLVVAASITSFQRGVMVLWLVLKQFALLITLFELLYKFKLPRGP